MCVSVGVCVGAKLKSKRWSNTLSEEKHQTVHSINGQKLPSSFTLSAFYVISILTEFRLEIVLHCFNAVIRVNIAHAHESSSAKKSRPDDKKRAEQSANR